MDTIGEPTVYDRNAWRLVAHCGWNAMPSNPPSELALTVNEMKLLAVVTFGVFGNTRTRPCPPRRYPSAARTSECRLPGACKHRERLIEGQVRKHALQLNGRAAARRCLRRRDAREIRRPRIEPDRDTGRRGRRRARRAAVVTTSYGTLLAVPTQATSNEDGPARFAATAHPCFEKRESMLASVRGPIQGSFCRISTTRLNMPPGQSRA